MLFQLDADRIKKGREAEKLYKQRENYSETKKETRNNDK
jgi:hypothetical protein